MEYTRRNRHERDISADRDSEPSAQCQPARTIGMVPKVRTFLRIGTTVIIGQPN